MATPSGAPSPRLITPDSPMNPSFTSMLRSSISQTDLRELRDFRAKAKSTVRWPHRHVEDRGLEKSGIRLDSHNVVENALESFILLFTQLSSDWSLSSRSQPLQPLSLTDLRSQIRSSLERVGSFPRGHGNISRKPSSTAIPTAISHWDSIFSSLEKLDEWLQDTSEHPQSSEVFHWLWRGIDFVFRSLSSVEIITAIGPAALELFCSALHELSVVLPNSLNYVAGKGLMLDVQDVIGLLYADVLQLVGSVVREVLLPSQPSAPLSIGGGIRQAFKGMARDYNNATQKSSGEKITVNTNVPPATAGSSPGSPTSLKKPATLEQWKVQLRTILELVIYHSKILHNEVSRLQAEERLRRVEKITNQFEMADEAEREMRKLEQLLKTEGRQQRGAGSSLSPGGILTDSSPLSGGSVGPSEEPKATLTQQYMSSKQLKKEAFRAAFAEAEGMKCDIFIYTAFEGDAYHGRFLEDLGKLSQYLSERGTGQNSESPSKAEFRLYITNEDTIQTLKLIDPKYLLDEQGTKAVEERPNIWSFARKRTPIKSAWHSIRTTLPNSDNGYGSESGRYIIEAHEKKGYFYDTTWKIYWCQPQPTIDRPNPFPVAILVLPSNDAPLGRPIDHSKGSYDIRRKELMAYYRARFHLPLIERRKIVLAENLAVQILAETKRRWKEVLEQMRFFVNELTDMLYVQALNSTSPSMDAIEQHKAARAIEVYNNAAGQVFKILIKVNSYESMLIETISNLKQLEEEDRFLGTFDSELLQPQGHVGTGDDAASKTSQRPQARSINHPISHNGLHVHKVSWHDVVRGHQDLLDTLKSTKRQAESLKNLIDHQNSMYESRLSNRLGMVANYHASEASRQADEAAAQNASMRRLTVVTFVFLPLTFMASLFGTNVQELGQGHIRIWVFFAVGFPFAALVLASWAYLEFWKQRTKSDGKGGELGNHRREDELEMGLLRTWRGEAQENTDGVGGPGSPRMVGTRW